MKSLYILICINKKGWSKNWYRIFNGKRTNKYTLITAFFIMKKTNCDKCGFAFTNKGGNFFRHYKSCDGKYIPQNLLKKCDYCNLDFSDLTNKKKASHMRWCKNHPNRNVIKDKEMLAKARKFKRNFENQYTKAKKQGLMLVISLNTNLFPDTIMHNILN